MGDTDPKVCLLWFWAWWILGTLVRAWFVLEHILLEFLMFQVHIPPGNFLALSESSVSGMCLSQPCSHQWP